MTCRPLKRLRVSVGASPSAILRASSHDLSGFDYLRPAANARLAFCIAAAALFLIPGCASKRPSTRQIRTITAEVVAAAQFVSAHKATVTIRPEMLPASQNSSAHLESDNIAITFANPSDLSPFRNLLQEIARKHKLSLAQIRSSDAPRFEFEFNGKRTHSIEVALPSPEQASQPSQENSPGPKLAIIIDDLGYDRASADSVLALPFPVTVSVIPHLALSRDIADAANRRGDQVLLHLPMQSESSEAKQETIELRPGMNSNQVTSALAGMLGTVPHVVGVNNHEGSRATSDPQLMRELMPTLRAHGLFFIDSRTTAATVAYDMAERFGVPAASRKVFLDDAPSRGAILAQIHRAASDASRDGSAIAIGHPHPQTIAALASSIPQLQSRGIQIVFASEVVH